MCQPELERMLEHESEETIPCYIGPAKPMNERPAPLIITNHDKHLYHLSSLTPHVPLAKMKWILLCFA